MDVSSSKTSKSSKNSPYNLPLMRLCMFGGNLSKTFKSIFLLRLIPDVHALESTHDLSHTLNYSIIGKRLISGSKNLGCCTTCEEPPTTITTSCQYPAYYGRHISLIFLGRMKISSRMCW
ncbi:hypothetical protein DVH24_006214 [Malus domestica]|uniref:Uncharacterized protein n=1 Tax=Malus domestica TaxID=3750 RepID=A0A498KC67_MALDO|nr:hypothetical protein DVH24_006214 [Malus domestica]